ncbi:hypothetical protein PSPO01_02532 [Paraphaeosphaeria sporulosa]
MSGSTQAEMRRAVQTGGGGAVEAEVPCSPATAAEFACEWGGAQRQRSAVVRKRAGMKATASGAAVGAKGRRGRAGTGIVGWKGKDVGEKPSGSTSGINFWGLGRSAFQRGRPTTTVAGAMLPPGQSTVYGRACSEPLSAPAAFSNLVPSSPFDKRPLQRWRLARRGCVVNNTTRSNAPLLVAQHFSSFPTQLLQKQTVVQHRASPAPVSATDTPAPVSHGVAHALRGRCFRGVPVRVSLTTHDAPGILLGHHQREEETTVCS